MVNDQYFFTFFYFLVDCQLSRGGQLPIFPLPVSPMLPSTKIWLHLCDDDDDDDDDDACSLLYS